MSGWQTRLRESGYRLTPQRQLVLEAVAELGHATPDEIATSVHRTASGVNISTVYRTLELLEELGLVRHTHIGHGSPTYHVADVAPHLHLVCSRCEQVEEVPTSTIEPLAEQLRRDRGFLVDVGHVALTGLCRNCS